MKDKIIVIWLAFCMIFTSISFAFAEENIEETKEPAKIEQVEETVDSDSAVEQTEVKEEEKTEKPIAESMSADKEEKVETKTEVIYPIKITWHIKYRDVNGLWTEFTSSSVSTIKDNSTTVKPSFSALQNKVVKGELYNEEENTTYVFNSKYEDNFGNSYVTLSKAIAASSEYEGSAVIKTDKSIDVYFTAQYRIKPIVHNLTGIYSDHIGHTSGSWSTVSNQETILYTHTFKNAEDVPNHYEFLYWEDQENNDIAYAKEEKTWDLTAIPEDIEFTYKATYNYQPSIRVLYHYKNKIKDTGATWSDIDIYENQPEDLYWFYKDSTEPIAKGTVASLPAIIEKITEKQDYAEQVDVYAHYYTVTFINENGEILEVDENVPYGTIPSYDSNTPTKEATKQYTYKFTGWDKDITQSVTDNITYVATYLPIINKYKVTFVDEDESILKDTTEYDYGTAAEEIKTPENPNKETTAQFTYSFDGWFPALQEVIEDIIYKAIYSATVNQYTVTFMDEDGTILKEATQYDYGTAASEISKPANPTKAATAQYTYTFAGWTPEISSVTSDVIYTATYSSTVNTYTVIWQDWNSEILNNETYEYGQIPTYKDEDPVKKNTAQYSYEFIGWTPEISEVTDNVIYTAVYNETVNKYTITFVDEDGTILSTADYEYGTAAEDIELPTSPVKEADEDYTYSFKAWAPKIVDVTEDATYMVTYTATAIPKPTPAAPTLEDENNNDNNNDNPVIPVPTNTPNVPIFNNDGVIVPAATETVTPVDNDPEDIIEEPVPLAEPNIGNWALLNLICAMFSSIIAIILLFIKKKIDNEEEEYTDEEQKDIRGIRRFKIYSILVGLISIVAFILTENMSLPMILIDQWTILMAILLIVNIVNIFIMRKKSKIEEDNDNE